LLHKFNKWVDQFQQQLSLPTAQTISQKINCPLISIERYLRVKNAFVDLVTGKSKMMFLVLGPFPTQILHDQGHSWWHGFKGIVHEVEVASVICRLDRSGRGGFYAVKLWDLYNQGYIYHGDPAQERQLKPAATIELVSNHLTSQYHVGFVEDKKLHKKPPRKPSSEYEKDDLKWLASIAKKISS
jgi:hypothetical protein